MLEINVKVKPATKRSIYRRARKFYLESINIDRSGGPHTHNYLEEMKPKQKVLLIHFSVIM